MLRASSERSEGFFARFDAKLEQRLAELRAALRQEIAEIRLQFRTELQQVRTEVQQVRTEVQQVRTELLRWMFGFWVTTLLALAGMMIGLR